MVGEAEGQLTRASSLRNRLSWPWQGQDHAGGHGMVDSQRIEMALAGAADLAAVRSFYGSVGYGGGLSGNDHVLLASRARSIVAAARLSREHGELVLRGMYVAEPLRGAGIGSRLLERISAEIGSSACWCIPYTRLEVFYARIGFRDCGSGAIPGFLSVRRIRYTSAGHEVMIMGRPEGWNSRQD